jgi:hypothetical protein
MTDWTYTSGQDYTHMTRADTDIDVTFAVPPAWARDCAWRTALSTRAEAGAEPRHRCVLSMDSFQLV